MNGSNPWDIEVGQVWDDELGTMLVLRDVGSERFECLILRSGAGNVKSLSPGATVSLSAFVIQYGAERIV